MRLSTKLLLAMGALGLVAATGQISATNGPVTWGAATYYPSPGTACVLLDGGALTSDPVATDLLYKATCVVSTPDYIMLTDAGIVILDAGIVYTDAGLEDGGTPVYVDAGIQITDAGIVINDAGIVANPSSATMQLEGSTDPTPTTWLSLPNTSQTCSAAADSGCVVGWLQTQAQVGAWTHIKQTANAGATDGGSLCCSQFAQ